MLLWVNSGLYTIHNFSDKMMKYPPSVYDTQLESCSHEINKENYTRTKRKCVRFPPWRAKTRNT